MKNILITQKIKKNKFGEIEWLLENNWYDYSKRNKINLICADPNLKNFNNDIHGVIFSGGNDLYLSKPAIINKIRDNLEKKILKIALQKKIPILGVCRGFQLIASVFNCKSNKSKLKTHVRKIHNLKVKKKIFNLKLDKLSVNSFHDFIINKLPNFFDFIVKHDDGSIELAYSKKYKILNFMFHPERYNPSQKKIDKIFNKHFKIK